MKNYAALTIGPIGDVLHNAKKTKELWTGSYMFSFLMREILLALPNGDYENISPPPFTRSDIRPLGVGLFHDRFIVCSLKEDEAIHQDIRTAVNTALDKLAELICAIQPAQPSKKPQVIEFLHEFLQISWVVTTLDPGENVFFALNGILDCAELQRTFPLFPADRRIFQITQGGGPARQVDPVTYLQHRFHSSAFKDEAFDSLSHFPSLPEIAASELISPGTLKWATGENINEDEINFPKDTPLKFKYAAIIQADGDNIGELIKKVGCDTAKAKQFSDCLLEFARSVPGIAKPYGAVPIYAGGDDVLSFAPLVYQDYTVFDFLDALNMAFKDTFAPLNEPDLPVSLSFGVTIIYFKFPLYEALQKTADNLFGRAKNFTLAGMKPKNAIAVELIKHSGQTLEDTFLVTDSQVYEQFRDLLKKELKQETTLPHNLHHSLARSRAVLTKLAAHPDAADKLESFFTNSFNEAEHSSPAVQEGLNCCRRLLQGYFTFYGVDLAPDQIFDRYLAALAMIKHLRGDR